MWLAASFFLLGSVYHGMIAIAFSTALHAFVGGAIGTLALALMVHASTEEYGPLPRGIVTMLFALVNIGALLRVSAEWVPFDYVVAISLAGVVWSSAFLLFMLMQVRQQIRHGYSSRTT